MTTQTTSAGSRKRWKLSLWIGGSLGIVPLLAGMAMFGTSPSSLVSRFAYVLFGLGLPGLLLEALTMREPHGGGTPLEMLLIVMPFNIIIYTVLSYAAMTVVAKLTKVKR